MSITLVVSIILGYFTLVWLMAYFTGRKSTTNDAFFLGNRQSPWWAVAIGMVGSSVSGVSFVSVPGMVRSIDFTYMQTVFGFFFGYLIVAHVLLPLYYRLNLTTIYTYLNNRFGNYTYKTGAAFFLLSKTIGAAARLYVVALILQTIIFDASNIPFWLTVTVIVFLIWLYTFRSGIKSIVWTDLLQTIVSVVVLVWILILVYIKLDVGVGELYGQLINSSYTRIFVFDDWHSKQHFLKQFVSGIFIVIVMTGLDQDMMQKNLTCRNLKEARKNMSWYGAAFIPFNFLFLMLGAMLLMFATKYYVTLPNASDEILPFVASHYLGNTVLILFVLGIVSSTLNSADSALTSLTTSFSVDILGVQKLDTKTAEQKRKIVHFVISVIFVFVILVFKAVNNKSVIDAIYTIVSYTYGPLLGMYAFGLFTKRDTRDKLVPVIAIASPLICFLLQLLLSTYCNYTFGYELLMLNGLLTFGGMWMFSQNASVINKKTKGNNLWK